MTEQYCKYCVTPGPMTCHQVNCSVKEKVTVLHAGESGCQEDVPSPGLKSLTLGCNDDKHREVATRLPAAEAAQKETDSPLTHQWSNQSGHASASLFCCPLTQACSYINSMHPLGSVIHLTFVVHTVKCQPACSKVRMVQICWHFPQASIASAGKSCSLALEVRGVPD